jgi:L-fuconolactonase
MANLTRRTVLGATAAAGVQAIASAQTGAIPIIDTHIHLYDQTRPQGAPYSGGKGSKEPSLPPRYRKLATPLGIVGAIKIEASPWIEDNLWVLEVAQTDPIIVGVVGNLQPEKAEFKEYLDRYHKNKLFRGIRYGNLWGYDLVKQVGNPTFIEGLKLLQQADMTMDTANPRADLLEAVLKVSDKVPGLRIVLDHLPAMYAHLDAAGKSAVEPTVRELGKRPQIYVKLSENLVLADGKPVTDPAVYKPTLDYLCGIFGEDRVMFGSDWPHDIAVDNLPSIVKIVQDYFKAKSRAAAEKYFWRNSIAAYKWVKRDASQPQA